MPTQVERALERFFDEFLGRNFTPSEKLNDAFQKIDRDIASLSDASADTLHKMGRDPGLNHDFAAIGDAFLTVGNDLHKAEMGGEAINGLIGLLFPGGGAAGIQADLGSADHKLGTTSSDLMTFGIDFHKIDTSRTQQEFDHKIAGLVGDSTALAGDMAADQAAFMTLGADFLHLGGDANALVPAVFKELGGDLQKVAADFGSLATDFRSLGEAVAGYQTGGSGTPADPNAMPVGTALMTLFHDFHALGADTGAIAHDAAVLVSDLIQPPVAPNGNHPSH
jgi:hypothetical protein